MHRVEKHEEYERGEDESDHVELEARIENVTRALLANVDMPVLATGLAANPLVLFPVDLPAVLLTEVKRASAILILHAPANDGILTAAAHLAFLAFQRFTCEVGSKGCLSLCS